jgi:hypothetical protein
MALGSVVSLVKVTVVAVCTTGLSLARLRSGRYLGAAESLDEEEEDESESESGVGFIGVFDEDDFGFADFLGCFAFESDLVFAPDLGFDIDGVGGDGLDSEFDVSSVFDSRSEVHVPSDANLAREIGFLGLSFDLGLEAVFTPESDVD